MSRVTWPAGEARTSNAPHDFFIFFLHKKRRQHIKVTLFYLLSARSVLLPTSMMMTSLPLSVRTSSIHFDVCWNEFTSVWGDKQKKTKQKQSGNKVKDAVCEWAETGDTTATTTSTERHFGHLTRSGSVEEQGCSASVSRCDKSVFVSWSYNGSNWQAFRQNVQQ